MKIENVCFVKGGKPEYPEKNPRSKDDIQQRTKPTIITAKPQRQANEECRIYRRRKSLPAIAQKEVGHSVKKKI